MEGLHIHGAAHAYGDNQVLSEISMVVPGGELVCLLGPSGCGKSTLLRLAAGLEILQEGTIVIDDVPVAPKEVHVPPEQRRGSFRFRTTGRRSARKSPGRYRASATTVQR